MNDSRRRKIREVRLYLDEINDQLLALDAEEQVGEAGDIEERDRRVWVWRERCRWMCHIMDEVMGEEITYGNCRGSSKTAIGNLRAAVQHLRELYRLEDKAGFTVMFHQKYDEIGSCCDTASQQ